MPNTQEKKRESGQPATRRTIPPLAFGAAALCLLIPAIPPDLYWGDSPELAAAAWTLGVPHPTGYPAYMLALRLFQCLPVGTIAFRSHLFSAVCMAAAAAVWYAFLSEFLAARRRGGGMGPETAPAAAALAFVLTPVAWQQAAVTEVYAFMILLAALSARLFYHAWNHPASGGPLLFCVLGLQLAHHRLSVFWTAAAALLFMARLAEARRGGPENIPAARPLFCLAMLILPLSLYLYIPLRAMADPPINWFDPDQWDRFVQYIGGEMYQSILAGGIFERLAAMPPGQWFFFLAAPIALYNLAALPLAAGAAVLARDRRAAAALCLGLYLTHQLFLLAYPVGDWQVFLLPALLIASIPLAAGLDAMVSYLRERGGPLARTGTALAGLFALAPLLAPSDAGLIPTKPLSLSAAAERYASGRDRTASRYAESVWDAAGPDAAAVVTGLYYETADNEYFPLLYQQTIGERGADTPLIGANFTRYDWYRAQINERYGLNLPMNQDRIAPSREAWLEDAWNGIVAPLLERGAVIVPSPFLPPEWYERARVRNIEMDHGTAAVPESYQRHLPRGFIQRLETRPEGQ